MEINRIASLLEKTFDGPAWHGPSVMETLKGISQQTATNNISGSHSIGELVMHMTAWRNFTIKRLLGDNLYEVSDAENFPAATNWDEAMNKLKESQIKLLAALKTFPEERLFMIVPSRKYDFYTLLHGIVQHDIYHTGQIILLKK